MGYDPTTNNRKQKTLISIYFDVIVLYDINKPINMLKIVV
jgi:hypothetical protein